MNNSKREINNFKKNLKEEFYLAFEEITIRSRSNFSIAEETNDDFLLHTLNLFLEAQNEGKHVNDVIGTNVDTYIKNYKNNVLSNTKSSRKIFNVIKFLPLILLVFTLVTSLASIVSNYTVKEEINLTANIDTSFIVNLLFSIFVVMIIFKLFESKKFYELTSPSILENTGNNKVKKFKSFLVLYLISLLLLLPLVIMQIIIKKFNLNTVFFSTNILYIILSLLLIFVVFEIIDRKSK